MMRQMASRYSSRRTELMNAASRNCRIETQDHGSSQIGGPEKASKARCILYHNIKWLESHVAQKSEIS